MVGTPDFTAMERPIQILRQTAPMICSEIRRSGKYTCRFLFIEVDGLHSGLLLYSDYTLRNNHQSDRSYPKEVVPELIQRPKYDNVKSSRYPNKKSTETLASSLITKTSWKRFWNQRQIESKRIPKWILKIPNKDSLRKNRSILILFFSWEGGHWRMQILQIRMLKMNPTWWNTICGTLYSFIPRCSRVFINTLESSTTSEWG